MVTIFTPNVTNYEHHDLCALSLALIGNASGQGFWGEEGLDPRRFRSGLGGSRWRLRRTRCAMGFQRQSVGQTQSRGRTPGTGRGGVRWMG